MQSFIAPEEFQRGFEAAFSKPALESCSARDLWLDLEIVSDRDTLIGKAKAMIALIDLAGREVAARNGAV